MHDSNERIIGIDPGLAITGIGILDTGPNKLEPVYCGCIKTKKSIPVYTRLNEIFNSINDIIKEYSPDYMAVEKLFFSSNTKTAIDVGQARGVSLLAGSSNNIQISEYTPLEVKQAVVGYGKATKNQIKYMLKILLKKDDDYFPKVDDAWDAMAIAICHANSMKFKNKISSY